MKTTLFIISIFLTIINACNRNTKGDSSNAATSERTELSPTIDSIKNNIASDSKKEKDNNAEEYFTLLNATSESWVSGLAGGGSGTEYYFKIKINTADKLLFDSAWVNNKAFPVFISKASNSISSAPVKYANGDIIIVRISDIKKSNSIAVNSNPPRKFEGVGLISFTVNEKQKYFIIKEIEKQISPNRQ